MTCKQVCNVYIESADLSVTEVERLKGAVGAVDRSCIVVEYIWGF